MIVELGGGYMGVYSTVLVNLVSVPSHNIKSLIEKSLTGNILYKCMSATILKYILNKWFVCFHIPFPSEHSMEEITLIL